MGPGSHWRGWGAADQNRDLAASTGKAPESPGGTTSYAEPGMAWGPGGDEGDTSSWRLALWGAAVGYANGSHGPGGRRDLNTLGLLVVTPGQTTKLPEPQGHHLHGRVETEPVRAGKHHESNEDGKLPVTAASQGRLILMPGLGRKGTGNNPRPSRETQSLAG